MKPIALGLLLLMASFRIFAQNPYAIKGAVTDTASKTTLENTSVSVLNKKDSTLIKFTRARADGSFTLADLKKGEFLLMITYPQYVDYMEPFSLDSLHASKDFGKINMILKAKLLQEVMIKGAVAAIKIKGDTTEFNAKAFVIQPNSKVEDLLKQLPGIQIDKDGKITAQGETVSKVLVDGEEFFGDDPTLVTKNIRGDMVDKVQLYDKKSDQAVFSGIDDGQKTKTINIKLKEDSKKGYFGKLDGGGAADDLYQGQAMFNSFKAKRKLSAYSTVANTGKTGLSWEDQDKYGSSSNDVQLIDGGIMISGGSYDDMSSASYSGEGIPLARNGGVHYDTKWKDDKYSVNANYKINQLEVSGTRNTLTQNNRPSGIINTNADQNSYSKTFRQKVDLTYQVKIDSTTSLKIMTDGTLKNTNSNSSLSSLGLRTSGTRINENSRQTNNDGDQQIFNVNAFLTKRLKKAGRTFSLNLNQAYNQSNTEGYLNSLNNYYDELDVYESKQEVNQRKLNDLESSILNSKLTYTEPISKQLALTLTYGMALNNSSANKRSFNQSSPGVYDVLDNIYSNNFKLRQLSNQGGAVFNFRRKKLITTLGTEATAVNFRQTDLYANKDYTRHFINWLPQASFQYNFSNYKSFQVYYNGSSQQPRIEQIQPIRTNDDPLNVVLGNADLNPSFSHRFGSYFRNYKVITGQSISFQGNFGFTSQPIVSNRVTDQNGRSTIQAVNLKDNSPYNYSVYARGDRKIGWGDMNVGITLNTSGNINYNYSDNQLNRTENYNYSARMNLSKYEEKKYDLYLSFGPSYSISQASLQKEVNNNARGFSGYGSFGFQLPQKIEVTTDINYTFQGKSVSFNKDFNQVLTSATLSKKFMKSESLKLSLSGNDLFNQNRGFSRNSSSNIFTQSQYNTISRYFLFSLSWDFSKMGGASPKN